MPKLIDIPGVGEIEFPDDMNDADIASEAGRLSMEATASGDKWSDLPGNILPSVGRLIGDAVSGVASLPGMAMDLVDMRPNPTKLAVGNALTHPIDTATAVGKSYADKYGSGAALKHSLITDPAGVAADASVLLGGVGAGLRGAGTAAKIPGLVRAGEMAATAGNAVDPLRGLTNVAAAGGQKFLRPTTKTLQDWGTGWMRSAMKVSKTIQDSNVDDVARNAAELKIMPTVEGFQQAAAQAKEWGKKAHAIKREAYKAGTRLDPERIVHSLDRQTQVASRRNAKPQKITSAMRDSREQFWDANSQPSMVEQPLVSPVQTTTGIGVPQPAGGPLSATMDTPATPLAQRTGTGWGEQRPPQTAIVPTLSAPVPTTTGLSPVAAQAAEPSVLRGVTSDSGFPVRPQTSEVTKMVEGPRQPVPITVGRSMAMTEELNSQIPFAKKNGMSMLGPLTNENRADDALRRAIKLERERVVPGFNAINEERGKRIAIMKQLQNYTLRREGNLDPIPARALLGGGMAAGLAVGGAPMGAVIGGTVVPWVVNSPKFKGDMAIKLFHGDKLLNKAGQAARTGATATTRTGVASDALRQALLDAMNKTTEQP